MLQDVWSIPLHGFELSLNFGGIEAFFHHFVFPAAAIAGAALALKDRRLALAGLQVRRCSDMAPGVLSFVMTEDQVTRELARIDLRRSVLENMLQSTATSQQQREEIELELHIGDKVGRVANALLIFTVIVVLILLFWR